jgi:translation initiation factor 3 subunit E
MRYLTAAMLTLARSNSDKMIELVKIITHETYKHQDAITDFVRCLYVDFDFEQAQLMLKDCDTVR